MRDIHYLCQEYVEATDCVELESESRIAGNKLIELKDKVKDSRKIRPIYIERQAESNDDDGNDDDRVGKVCRVRSTNAADVVVSWELLHIDGTLP